MRGKFFRPVRNTPKAQPNLRNTFPNLPVLHVRNTNLLQDQRRDSVDYGAHVQVARSLLMWAVLFTGMCQYVYDGCFYAFCCSGKTTELIRRIRRLKIARRNCLVRRFSHKMLCHPSAPCGAP